MRHSLTLLFCIGLCLSALCGRHRVFRQNDGRPLAQKEAVLVLAGFGSKVHGTKKIARFFFNRSYDVYIPHYIARNSINGCVENLDEFMRENKLADYKKVHVFSYIVGAWTLNHWIAQHPVNNISSIIYDRSPLQERAPYALVADMPFLIGLAAGPIMKEFANTPYPPLPKGNYMIGIVIEGKATDLVKKHKAAALAPGPVSWRVQDLRQDHDDFFFTLLDHDDMYTRIELIGEALMHFFGAGRFPVEVPRTMFDEDPFVPTKKSE